MGVLMIKFFYIVSLLAVFGFLGFAQEETGGKISIVTLIENTNDEDHKSLKAEHGISMYIDKYKLIFDLGRTAAFAENAKKLGIELKDVEHVVISHAHLDHGGGLSAFLKINRKAKIYLHENCKNGYYFDEYYIGLERELFSTYPGRFVFIEKDTEIIPGIKLIVSFGDRFLKPKNDHLFSKENGRIAKDNFDHEIAMTINDGRQLLLLTGCSHNGILNMIQATQDKFPDRNIDAVVGGFHLMKPGSGEMSETKETVTKMAKQLDTLPIKNIYTGHCTGKEAYLILKSVLKNKLHPFKTGTVIEY